eukprot:6658813-Prymnesium_polylepis.1
MMVHHAPSAPSHVQWGTDGLSGNRVTCSCTVVHHGLVRVKSWRACWSLALMADESAQLKSLTCQVGEACGTTCQDTVQAGP